MEKWYYGPVNSLWLQSLTARLTLTILVAAWMSFIFYLSSQSPSELPAKGAFDFLGDLTDVVGHLGLYGILGTLLLLTSWSWVRGSNEQTRWAVITVIIGILYGASDEYHQAFTPLRSASLFDVLIDGIGVVVSIMSVRYVTHAWSRRKHPDTNSLR